MNVWDWVNLSAWVLVGLMLFAMLGDFVRVERSLKNKAEREASQNVR